jgi:PAS domain S-box-containing protein
MDLNQVELRPQLENSVESSRIRVLHVDDDENQLDMTKIFLTQLDESILVQSEISPNKALLEIEQGKFDCIVLDFKMPEMTGIDLARKIRKETSTPIILYTGQGSEEVAEEAFSVGIDDYIRKEMSPSHYQLLAKRIRDIVEKRKIEQVYTNVVKDAKDAISIFIGEKLVFANEAFLRLVGASSEKEILNDSIINMIIGVDKKTIQNEMENIIQNKLSYFVDEQEIRRRDRKKIPVEIKTSVIDYKGERALLFILRDVSDRKILEKGIKESEIKYRSLVELAPDGIITIDLRGNVTWVNEAYITLTGFNADEIIGKKVWSLKTARPLDVGKFLGMFIDLLKGHSVPSTEFQWKKKDGSNGWGEGRASLIKIDGKMTEVLLSLRDITERKQMEEDLKKFSKEMKIIAQERAQKLLESEKMVVAGEIASTVAHDLKGPLNTILNAVYLIDAKPEKAAEMKQIIVTAVGNASRMIDEARGKTTSRVNSIEQVDAATLIELILKETLIPSRIEVKTDLEHVVVEIDKLRIRRVIENIIRNAIDAMPSKGSLSISDWREGEKAAIQVKDSGVGIPKKIIGKLFTAFNTTKENGTGLGLHYCKMTMDEYGGEIEVKSKVGSGSIFTLKIPMKRSVVNKELVAVVNV